MIAGFAELRSYLKKTAGIVLDEDKHYFAESRLMPLARKIGENNVEGLLRRFGANADAEIGQSIIEAMTTHETLFFRDRQPFELFSQVVLPQLMQARAAQRTIRIWCAGCATGQEPYSLAMLLDEQARSLAGWRIEILATDISRAALSVARAASYNQFEVQRGLPVSMLLRYFNREADRWRLVEHLRARVDFREVNLVTDFSSLGPFDVVFCRNVLIYFDAETRNDVLSRIAGVCRPDASLILGAAESIGELGNFWQVQKAHAGLITRQPAASTRFPKPRLVSNT